MKRIVTTALSALLVAFLFGLTGCEGGGGVEPGLPTDTAPAVPVDVMKGMADMTKSGTPPPSTAKATPKKPEVEEKK
jgi:pyrroline-5-carboxylate reductase